MRLAPFDFNLFVMFVIDLLHEFELGVWKAIFIHLMRILHAAGGNCIQELNRRYVISTAVSVALTISDSKVPRSPNIWTWNYSTIPQECLSYEATRSPRL